MRALLSIASGTLVIGVGCGPTATTGKTPVPDSTAKPATQTGTETDAGLDGSQNNPDNGQKPNPIAEGSSFLNASYNINATALGISVCKGEIQIKINANPKPKDGDKDPGIFEVPVGAIDCPIVGKIDLAEILGKQEGDSKIKVINDVIAFEQLGLGKYSEPRPFLPSFIAASKESLKKLNVTVNTTLNDTKENKTANGTSTLRTLAMDAKHTPPDMGREFKKVLHIEVTNDGYEGVNKVKNFIFDRMEFKINLDPVSIVFIEFEGPVSDLAAARPQDTSASTGTGTGTGGGILGGGGALGAIVGLLTKVIQVHITMDLVKQEGLDKQTEDSETSGPVIGGQKQSDDE